MKYLNLLVLIMLFSGLALAQSSTEIEVDVKKTEPAPLQTSEYADVWLEVRNTGDADADNVELEFLENYPFSTDPDEKTSWDLGELVPGEEYQVHMEVRVDDNAVSGNNSMKFRTTADPSISITRDVNVEVRSDNNILNVRNVTASETVAPGGEGRVELRMQNMADSQLKNIRVELDLSDSDIPVATRESSAKNFENLESGETLSTVFRLKADSSAENGVYRLPVQLDYENEAGSEFEDSVTTALDIGGEPRLEVGLTNEDVLEKGSQNLNFRVVNQGYGTADFVEVTLKEAEGYEILSPDSVYIGEMESDDFQTAEFQVFVEQTGDISVPLELDYSDREDQSITRDVDARVLSDEEMQEYGMSSSNRLVPVAIVLVIVAAGGIYYWRKRKRG